MITKLTNYLPIAKAALIKGAALAAYVVDAMKDLRSYDPAQDPTRDYRAEDIAPEIRPLLDKARQRRGQIWITEKGIDLILQHQAKDIEETKRYIRWKYLGELTYKEAFLEPVKEPAPAAEDLQAQIEQLQGEMKALTKALNDLRNTILIAN